MKMLCGKCDRCISMATGMDVKSRLKFGGFPLTTNCQLKNNEMLLYGGDYLSSFCRISNLEEKDPIGMRSIPLEDREDYKAAVAAEREACARIAALNVEPYQFRNEYAQLEGQKYGLQPFHVPPFSEWVIDRIATYKAGLIRARPK